MDDDFIEISMSITVFIYLLTHFLACFVGMFFPDGTTLASFLETLPLVLLVLFVIVALAASTNEILWGVLFVSMILAAFYAVLLVIPLLVLAILSVLVAYIVAYFVNSTVMSLLGDSIPGLIIRKTGSVLLTGAIGIQIGTGMGSLSYRVLEGASRSNMMSIYTFGFMIAAALVAMLVNDGKAVPVNVKSDFIQPVISRLPDDLPGTIKARGRHFLHAVTSRLPDDLPGTMKARGRHFLHAVTSRLPGADTRRNGESVRHHIPVEIDTDTDDSAKNKS